ncbi:MutS-like protein [Thermoflavifilum aggregans]|uniref:MutS-like protein n=1 Tax=Thermoflavifilum aggregans TaxID=454188 RepID=A0A2M9CV40_9BACT|nr:hypothetical protein [Thermoflavifilum aggregans]PJJ75753.1 MutS-like protein [Thermoflavifilum aggregans]
MDIQTLYDLDIFTHDADSSSVYEHIHRFTLTTGGKEALQRRMLHPIFDYEYVCRVQQTILFFMQRLDEWKTSFHPQEIKYIEEYFHSNITPLDPQAGWWTRAWYIMRYGADYAFIEGSIRRLGVFIRKLSDFIRMHAHHDSAETLDDLHRVCSAIYADESKGWLATARNGDLKSNQLFYLDHFIRSVHRKEFQFILDGFYELDAWFAMAQATVEYRLVMPHIGNPGEPLEIQGLYHLFLPHAVRNDLYMDTRHHLIFLTGPNMAGKSTFLKAAGICVYLAHLGMGVPAESASVPVFDDLFTDIYITDKVEEGYSYFFNEVRRIRQLAEQLRTGKRLFVLMDEMFRGTNVQDAFDCSLAVVERLVTFRNTFILLASHLVELAHALEKQSDIRFYYFDATVENQQPRFSYQKKEGISELRLGKLILEQQQVLNLLGAGQDTTG